MWRSGRSSHSTRSHGVRGVATVDVVVAGDAVCSGSGRWCSHAHIEDE